MIIAQRIKVRINGTWKSAKFISYKSITEATVYVIDGDYMVVKLTDIRE